MLCDQDDVRSIAEAFVARVEKAWHEKTANGLDVMSEVKENLRLCRDGHSVEPTDEFILRLALEYEDKYGDTITDARLRTAPVGLLLLAWYSMRDVDIDRLH